ncbi:hypothetical protein DV36_12015 [Amycolatopsis mediterranei]|nr:hypothetical protein DV36_12015 [Amycolatopsis mediterranei]
MRHAVSILSVIAVVMALATGTADAQTTPLKVKVTKSLDIKPLHLKLTFKNKNLATNKMTPEASCDITWESPYFYATGYGPVGGPYTMTRVDGSWNTGVSCYGTPALWKLYVGNYLAKDGFSVAPGVEDECEDQCLSVLSPGEYHCDTGTACAGFFRIYSDEILTTYRGIGWTGYPDACVVDEINFPEQLICQHHYDLGTLPPVW